jgi:L-seryl-tRNA(Ser) seleniumtransferase
VALVLKVHPSNYRVEGFVEDTTVAELAGSPVPVVADIGSGLRRRGVPLVAGATARVARRRTRGPQTLAAGAALVTFSADKLLGGPQAGIIAGRADLVAACSKHPLARALRPGGLTLGALQGDGTRLPAQAGDHRGAVLADGRHERRADLRRRAEAIAARRARTATAVDLEALPGAGSAPGPRCRRPVSSVTGDHLAALRAADPPIVGRTRDGRTFLDLRTVDPADDDHLAATLAGLEGLDHRPA